jgi:restriction system protein
LSEKAEDHDAVHDQIRAAMEQLDLVQRQELLQKICRQSPEFFERLVIDLMLAMGYARERADLTRQLGRSGDGGVDGILQEDELGLSRIYFQAKRYKPGNPVPIAAIREFAGALDSKKVHEGLFMTTSRFPKSAFKFVSSVSRHIVLIDGDELTRRMMTHEVGVKRLAVYEIKCVDEAYFADESDD